jgi:NTP pyrophosphatase (non-canonical NTP hydrolase)
VADSHTTVADLRQDWESFVSARDWHQFHNPKNLTMALAVEAAELMEHFLWIDNEKSREVIGNAGQLEEVADEIADVTGVILALCNALGLDLTDAIRRKLAKNEVKYPADKVRGKYRLES